MQRKKISADEVLSTKKLNEIETITGLVFRNKKLLEQAFIHRSFLNETGRTCIENNERLEFLGDKILGFALGQYLYKYFPEANEGLMTAIFGVAASGDMLSKIAEELKLTNFLLLSKGERVELDGYKRSRKRILACTLEALIGALYLDRGPGAVEIFLSSVLFPKITEIVENQQYIDAKSQLQVETQKFYGLLPTYQVVEEVGPAHEKKYIVEVFLNQDHLATGEGYSKQAAEVEAARNALKIKFDIVVASMY